MTMHCKVNLEQEEAMDVDPDGIRTLTKKWDKVMLRHK